MRTAWAPGRRPKVAREIRQTVEGARPGELPRHDCVIAPVWSWCKLAPGSDEIAEDMPREIAVAQDDVRGYSLVNWCAPRLPSTVRPAGPGEMIWRMRIKQHVEQTKKLIAAWPR